MILKEGHTTEDYNVGDEIPENDIESYFVWIPRYKYRLFADIKNEYDTEIITKTSLKSTSELEIYSSGVKSIEIEFETKDAGITNSDVKGTYLTHPAFISFDSNGFWVGKFEAGTTLTDNYNTRNSEALQIKPNIYSWRRIQPANAFYTSYDYLRDLESHMIKNTEWGAVAYLASSLYGFCEESKCTAEIRFNNNSGHLTGYAASKEPTCGAIDINEECNKYEEVAQNTNGTYTYNYFDTRSQVASTTGNYSGVYDMSGGAWEYVMGVMQYSESSSEPASGRSGVNNHNSGFTGKYSCYNCNNGTETELTNGLPWPSSKYYDLYDYNGTTLAYLRGKLGDGTKEFGPFALVSYDYGTKIERRISSYYADTAAFVSSGAPWFMRGGNWSTGAESGIMAFISAYGNVDPWYGFRVVLTP